MKLFLIERLTCVEAKMWLFAACVLVGSTAWAQGDIDLSDELFNPTMINLALGHNAIENTVVSSSSDDIDFFTVVVSPGTQIDRVELTRYDGPAVSFIGFGAGSFVPSNPSQGAAAQAIFAQQALGFALVGDHLVESNILLNLADGDVTVDPLLDPPDLRLVAEPRFDRSQPLGAGSYAFVFQDTGPILVTYELDFQTSPSPVPEPHTLVVLGLGLAGLTRMRRRSAV